MKLTIDEAARKELISSYAIVFEGELAYQRQAMLNMFKKGAEWQKQQSYTEAQIKQAILDYCDENGMYDEEAKECMDDFINNFLNSGCSEKPNDQPE